MKLSKTKIGFIILITIILLLQISIFFENQKLKQEGIVAKVNYVEEIRNTKSGKTYKFNFLTKRNNEIQSQFTILRFNEKTINANAMFVVYCESNPYITVPLFPKSEHEKELFRRLINKKVSDQIWNYFDVGVSWEQKRKTRDNISGCF